MEYGSITAIGTIKDNYLGLIDDGDIQGWITKKKQTKNACIIIIIEDSIVTRVYSLF